MKVARNELEDQYIKVNLRLENSIEALKVKSELCKE